MDQARGFTSTPSLSLSTTTPQGYTSRGSGMDQAWIRREGSHPHHLSLSLNYDATRICSSWIRHGSGERVQDPKKATQARPRFGRGRLSAALDGGTDQVVVRVGYVSALGLLEHMLEQLVIRCGGVEEGAQQVVVSIVVERRAGLLALSALEVQER